METVQVRSHYGQACAIEQCQSCGGMWFDAYEHHRVADDQVAQLDSLNTKALARSTNIAGTLICPKDGTELKPFVDINFPADIVVESCPHCDGLWFNCGELSAYRTHVGTARGDQPPRSRTALLADAFLSLNATKEKAERDRAMRKAAQRETLLQLLVRVLRPSASNKASVVLAPLWIVLAVLYAASSTDDKLYVDMEEFKKLLTEAEQQGDREV